MHGISKQTFKPGEPQQPAVSRERREASPVEELIHQRASETAGPSAKPLLDPRERGAPIAELRVRLYDAIAERTRCIIVRERLDVVRLFEQLAQLRLHISMPR